MAYWFSCRCRISLFSSACGLYPLIAKIFYTENRLPETSLKNSIIDFFRLLSVCIKTFFFSLFDLSSTDDHIDKRNELRNSEKKNRANNKRNNKNEQIFFHYSFLFDFIRDSHMSDDIKAKRVRALYGDVILIRLQINASRKPLINAIHFEWKKNGRKKWRKRKGNYATAMKRIKKKKQGMNI